MVSGYLVQDDELHALPLNQSAASQAVAMPQATASGFIIG
jgi:hypothetical protein